MSRDVVYVLMKLSSKYEYSQARQAGPGGGAFAFLTTTELRTYARDGVQHPLHHTHIA